MYTPDKLLEIAAKAETDYNAGKNLADNHSLMEAALICARWMEDNGVQEIENIGPFNTHSIRRGDKVRIRKGSTIKSMNGKTYEAKVSYTITVHDVYAGWAGYHHLRETDVRNAIIVWSGRGGYWKETDINNVSKNAKICNETS